MDVLREWLSLRRLEIRDRQSLKNAQNKEKQRPNFSNGAGSSCDSHNIVLNTHSADQSIRLRHFLTALRSDSSLAANIMLHASPTG